jgi:hypothetical protein
MSEDTTTETTEKPAPTSGEGNALESGATETETGTKPEAEPSPHRVPSSVQRRIDAEVRRRGEAEREASAVKVELETLKRQIAEGNPAGGQPAPTQRANESDAEFDKRVDARAQQILAQREHDTKIKAFGAAGAKDYSDFDDRCNAVAVLMDRSQIPAVMQIVTDIEDGHVAIAKLADDPDNAERIFKLPPHKMAIELAKLASEKTPKPKKLVSNAPAPIEPKTGNARSDGYRPNMTVEEHVEWANKHAPYKY